MFLEAFTDELISCGLTKSAFPRGGKIPDRLLQRLVAAGALSNASLYGAKLLKSSVVGDRPPQGSFSRSAIQGATGGLLATLALKGIGRLSGLGSKVR